MKLSHGLLIMAIGCGLAAGSVRAGEGGGSRAHYGARADSRLVIKRAANFGNLSNISLYIDGRLAGLLTYGRSYEGFLPPGRHFITMRQTPHLNDAYPFSQQWVWLPSGRTSTFTATWRVGGTWIALEKS